MTIVEQKAYWDLLETVTWIRTRDEERVATMWDMDEDVRIAMAMFVGKPELDPSSLQWVKKSPRGLGCRETAGEASQWKSRIDTSVVMGLSEAQDDLTKKSQSGRIRITAIRTDGSCNEYTEVPLPELNDLAFRLSPGPSATMVGLWSISRSTWAWRSPQFLRADVMRIWPSRRRKTAAVYGAVLHHLRQISTPEAPLTKHDAEQRCMDEVPNAYPEAFKNAWAKLEPNCKRGRGKHGPRPH